MNEKKDAHLDISSWNFKTPRIKSGDKHSEKGEKKGSHIQAEIGKASDVSILTPEPRIHWSDVFPSSSSVSGQMWRENKDIFRYATALVGFHEKLLKEYLHQSREWNKDKRSRKEEVTRGDQCRGKWDRRSTASLGGRSPNQIELGFGVPEEEVSRKSSTV